jgi:hypothetical protein
MRIDLTYIDQDGERHEVTGIWSGTWAAINWAQVTFGAVSGFAKPSNQSSVVRAVPAEEIV